MGKRIDKGFINKKVNGITINTSRKCHSSNYNAYSSRVIKYIVMHYTGNEEDTARANAGYFQGANRRASAHFFVDNNNIYQSVALKNVAWHCGGSTYYHKTCRNSSSIGIEMCCTAGNYKISQQTIENSAKLCAYLCTLVGITASQVDTYVLRHYDVTHKKCPAQMANSANDKDWIAFKALVKKELGGSKAKADDTYKVRITATTLNVRAGAGTNYNVVSKVSKGDIYTIIDEKKNGSTTWGLLLSGKANKNKWISLKYTEKV